MKCVLKYPGAKNRIADWIISFIPPHKVYLEPFAGSLAVLFNKAAAPIETVNDLHGDVVNFFKVLRDQPNDLLNQISLTPYSRKEYDAAYSVDGSESDIESARKFCIRCWQGFGCGNLYHNGFKSGQQSKSPNPANAWDQLPDTLYLAAKRLKHVQIENLPALDLIKRYNTKDVFIYADPPYLPGTRKGYLYAHEMTKEDHIEFLHCMKEHPGKVLISGYDNDLYNEVLKGWHKEQKQTTAEQGLQRVECLWMNYQMQMKLF